MKTRCSSQRLFPAPRVRLAAVLFFTLAWNGLALSDEIPDATNAAPAAVTNPAPVPPASRICVAAKNGDLQSVLALLRENPDLVSSKDPSGLTPLDYAVFGNQKYVAELLLEHHADPNARDNPGNTPLHDAAAWDRSDAAALLLVHGADVNAVGDAGNTPLHFAVASGDRDMVEMLLANNAAVNVKNKRGWTPLHLAAVTGRKGLVELLLAARADVNPADDHGWTPLQYAEDAQWLPVVGDGATAVAELLRQRGGHDGPAMPPGSAQTFLQSAQSDLPIPPLTDWQMEDLLQCKEQVALPPEIVAFITTREKWADEIAATNGFDLGPDLENFFAAAKAGRARQAEQIHYGFYNATNSPATNGSLRQVVIETLLVIEQFGMDDPELVMTLGKDYMDSLPTNCIYFGGTDAGRGLPTALCRAPGDPIFVLTQNALSSADYLQYVRNLYGSRLLLPTADDLRQCRDSYLTNAVARLQAGQLLPGEQVRIEDGATNVSGPVAVMQIAALVSREIFDQNPGRDFYYEQSFPLDWMYPYLTPHGVVMKLNRAPLVSLSTNDVTQDLAFWSAKIAQLQNNPKFAADGTRKVYSYLRCGIAGVYAWRGQNASGPGEAQRMTQAAQQAFDQSLQLWPGLPEAVFGYVNLEKRLQKLPDALEIAKAAVQADPANQQFNQLVQDLEQLMSRGAPSASPPAGAK